MKKTKHRTWNGRKWLNPVSSNDTGAISWEVEESSWGAGALLNIRDCSRQICLDFGFVSEAGRKRRLKKLRLIQTILSDMEDAMLEARLEKEKKR